MKNVLFGLLYLFPLHATGQEMNAIQETITTLFVATDQREWQAVEQCFSKDVTLDYSSMTGQPAVGVTPRQITDQWKTILPGFDHTHHQIGNLLIEERGDKASVFCYGTATHYLENDDESVWTVVGTYEFDLEKSGSDWKISAMKFNYKYQTGNTGLPQMAIARLTSGENPLSTAERNKNSVRQFFQALENSDINVLVDLFAENGKHMNPYHSGIFPTGAEGREGVREYWAPVFPNFDGMEFPIEEIYAMEDPNIIFVKYKGIIELKDNAGYYNNDYYSTFTFDSDGKITEYVEIFNPIVAARGFGLLDKIK